MFIDLTCFVGTTLHKQWCWNGFDLLLVCLQSNSWNSFLEQLPKYAYSLRYIHQRSIYYFIKRWSTSTLIDIFNSMSRYFPGRKGNRFINYETFSILFFCTYANLLSGIHNDSHNRFHIKYCEYWLKYD